MHVVVVCPLTEGKNHPLVINITNNAIIDIADITVDNFFLLLLLIKLLIVTVKIILKYLNIFVMNN